MKICLIGASSLKVAPYIKRYSMILDKLGIDYDIISKEYETEKSHLANADISKIFFYKEATSLYKKVQRFFAYADFVKSVIEKEKYDKMVIFTPLHAVIYYLRNGKKFYNQMPYILDVRDYNPNLTRLIVKCILKKIVRGAQLIIVSSPKFSEWLPQNTKTFTMHNIPSYGIIRKTTKAFQNDSIRVAYLGGINYFEQNKRIVESLEGSNIELLYAGIYPLSYNIKDYCKDRKFNGVIFKGQYNDREKDQLYEDVDIINSVYGNESLVVSTALPNKLYDSAFYKIPIMVNSGTYLESVVKKYNIGFAINPFKDNIAKSIYYYKEKFDPLKFEVGCEAFIKNVLIEQENTENQIIKFLGEE